MATPNLEKSQSAPEGKKKKRFSLKNGVKKLQFGVKSNKTVKHFTGSSQSKSNKSSTQNGNKNNSNSTAQSPSFSASTASASAVSVSTSNNTNNNNNNTNKDQDDDKENFYYVDPQKKKKKKNRKQLSRYKLNEYTFPENVQKPSESGGLTQYDDLDRKMHIYLGNKYENEIKGFSFWPQDILIRFVLSQRDIKNFEDRTKETETQFQLYLEYHKNCHYDDILTNYSLNSSTSLSSLASEINALPLCIYGQDKQGHPIFWDDGSAYGKSAKLDMFKKDMQRVSLFRARLMKRMHNIKLNASQKYGTMIYKHCLVMDLKSFNAKKFMKDRKFHEQNTKDVSDLFPEVMHRLYIINAPWAFRSAWKVIRSFLHPITVQKTKILGKDYMDELLRDIDIAMIPHKFGGRGPWNVLYGEAPMLYPLKCKDIKWDYDMLDGHFNNNTITFDQNNKDKLQKCDDVVDKNDGNDANNNDTNE